MAAVRLRRDRNTCRCWTLRRGKSPLSAFKSIHMRRWHEVAGILVSVHSEMLQIRSERKWTSDSGAVSGAHKITVEVGAVQHLWLSRLSSPAIC